MPSTLRTVEVSGATLSVESWGDGAPLLCLHGGMGLDGSYLKVPGILGLASPHRQVLVPDQRGHGRSSRCGPSRYNHATWVQDIFELCRAIGLARVALLGHSYGGFIALELALRHPALISQVVLVGTSAGPVPQSAASVHDDHELRALIRQRWPGFFAGDAKHWEVFDRLQVSAGPFSAALHRELPGYDLRDRIHAIASPTLLVVGSDDRYLGDMQWLHGALARSRLEVIPATGHMPFLEEPEVFQELVRDFLDATA